MFRTFINAWKIEDLRRKMLFTLFILLIFRLGAAIVVPFIDATVFQQELTSNTTTIFSFFDMMTGGSFSQATLFALSVTPYINASIIINLLQVVIPALERMAKEGEEGRKKINKITRYTAVGISFALAVVYYFLVKNKGALMYTEGFARWFSMAVIVLSFTAGAILLMWLGEQIDTNGIGNGISILIFTGIISNLFNVFPQIVTYFKYAAGTYSESTAAMPQFYILIPLVILIFAAMFVLIVFMNGSERRIPIQYAKRVVGRKMYGGQSTHFPIKVNNTGVLPVIFASALLSLPATIKEVFNITGGWGSFLGWFSPDNWGYAILYAVFIMGFNFFYVAVQYNPIQIANDLRKNSGMIPGIRPGQPTSAYIQRVLNRITMIGGIFLVIVAVTPIVLAKLTQINVSLGGTSVLIIVGVALEVSQTLDSYMLMRHHKGFLE